MKRIRVGLSVAILGIMLSLLAVACGGDDPTATNVPPPESTATSAPTALEALIAKAAATNHRITVPLEGTDPEVIRAWEAAWEEKFGFPLNLESDPGHHRDTPVKVIEAAKSGNGVIDTYNGGLPLVLSMFENGNTVEPPWEAVYEGWPLAEQLRAFVPAIPGAPDGSTLNDHCMWSGSSGWSLAYNTRNVDPSEVEGITLDDLTTEKWRDRVLWDVRALGLYVLPFAPGWSEDRMRVFAHNLGANGTKLISGGSTGLTQALIQGEGDISLVSMGTTAKNRNAGAPVEIAFAEVVLGNLSVTCILTPGKNHPDMAALWWAFENFEAEYIEAEISGSGAFRLIEAEASKLPLVRLAFEHGITDLSQVAGPKTGDEAKLAGGYRKTAIAALKAGIASGDKITQ
jgi:hypothetical protein